jgi:hypothetical protein
MTDGTQSGKVTSPMASQLQARIGLALAAGHASMAPLQELTEISLGVLLALDALASLALAVGRAGRTWGVDAILAQRRPSAIWW